MELDDEGFPHPTGEFETLDADTVILAVGQDPPSVWTACPAVEVIDGVIVVDDA